MEEGRQHEHKQVVHQQGTRVDECKAQELCNNRTAGSLRIRPIPVQNEIVRLGVLKFQPPLESNRIA